MEHIKIERSAKLAIDDEFEISMHVGEIDEELKKIIKQIYDISEDHFPKETLDQRALIIGGVLLVGTLNSRWNCYTDFLKFPLRAFDVWKKENLDFKEFPIESICEKEFLQLDPIYTMQILTSSTKHNIGNNLKGFFQSWKCQMKEGMFAIKYKEASDVEFLSRCGNCQCNFIRPIHRVLCPDCHYEETFASYNNLWTSIIETTTFKKSFDKKIIQIILIWKHCKVPLGMIPKDIIGVVARVLFRQSLIKLCIEQSKEERQDGRHPGTCLMRFAP